MVLNFGLQQFEREEFERRVFTGETMSEAVMMIAEGVGLTIGVNFAASILAAEKDNYGSLVTYSLANFSGASREIIIQIKNATTNEILSTVTVNLNDSFSSATRFYSLEKIRPGDIVEVNFGGEGVATGIGSALHGYYKVQLKSIFRREDESQ